MREAAARQAAPGGRAGESNGWKRWLRPAWDAWFPVWCDFQSVRQKSGRAAWHYAVTRPRILWSEPVRGMTDERYEVHALTSRRDWINLVWALKSFYWRSGSRAICCIHEDGTLTSRQKRLLRAHFPEARLVERGEADAKAREELGALPNCAAYRAAHPLGLKLTDVPLFRRSDRVLLVDSDVLFFARPDFLLERLEDEGDARCWFNADLKSAYVVGREELIASTGVPLLERINSGLAILQGAALDLGEYDRLLGLPGMSFQSWLTEQTVYALTGCRQGASLLPEEYSVRLGEGGPFGPCRHYVGAVRHLMYEEGMPQYQFS